MSEPSRIEKTKSAKEISAQAERIIGRIYWSNRGEENTTAQSRIRRTQEIANRKIARALSVAEENGIHNYEDAFSYGAPTGAYIKRRNNRR